MVLLLVVVIGGALYYYASKEYVLRFREDEIQAKLDSKLPITKTYFLVFQVTLDNPRVNLTNGSARVEAGLDITLDIRIGSEPKPLGGAVDVSGEIRYARETGDFFLTDPVIEHLALQGVPDRYHQKVKSALAKALVEYFADHPIYTLSAADAKQVVSWLVLKKVVVENQELVVTLGM